MDVCLVDDCMKPRTHRGFCAAHYSKMRKYGDPLIVKQKQLHGLSLLERWDAYVERSTGCWEWSGYRDPNGYGRLNIGNRPILAHRISWEIHHGPITPDQHVCHRCDNPSCVRPEHLFLGDQVRNMADKMAKKRHRYGVSRGEAHGCSKITAEQVQEIRAAEGTNTEIAKRFQLSRTQTRDIRSRKSWRHLP
jgi:hypothetical protein